MTNLSTDNADETTTSFGFPTPYVSIHRLTTVSAGKRKHDVIILKYLLNSIRSHIPVSLCDGSTCFAEAQPGSTSFYTTTITVI